LHCTSSLPDLFSLQLFTSVRVLPKDWQHQGVHYTWLHLFYYIKPSTELHCTASLPAMDLPAAFYRRTCPAKGLATPRSDTTIKSTSS
jgi:hypothetical protein